MPDGTRVYYKNAFLKNGTEVAPIFLGMKGENYLYLLEPLHGERSFYHVVEFKKAGDEYIFVQGYIYTRAMLINATLTNLNKGTAMALDDAKKAAEEVLKDYGAGSFSAGITPDGIAASVQEALRNQLSSDWSFTVKVTFTTKNITVPGNEDDEETGTGSESGNTGEGGNTGGGDSDDTGNTEDDENNEDNDNTGNTGEAGNTEEPSITKTIIDQVYITIDLAEAGAGETSESATVNKNIDLETKELETTLTGDALTSTTESTTGIRSDGTVQGITFAKGVLGDRAGSIFINESGGLTVKNGIYEFVLVYDSTLGVYIADPDKQYDGFKGARYNELKGRYFALSADKTRIQVFEMQQSGSGEIASTTGESGNTSYSLNGGYHRVNGGYLFVDDPAVTDANAGILYLLDRAVVVSTDGQVYPVAIEGNQIGAGQNMTDVTISFAPGMQQMRDSEGNPLYNNNGVIRTEVTASSIPVYDLRPVAKKDASGNQLYTVFNMTQNQYEINSRTGTREFTFWETVGYNNILFGPRYKVSPIYVNLPGFTIVRPVAGGFTVTYSTPSTFDIPLDDKGYGIINENMRVMIEDEGEFAAGTVLYLDDGKNVIALLTPEGKFFRYEQNTFYTPGIPEDQGIYTAYQSEGNGDNLDLNTEISAGSQTLLHEIMTGLYMSVPDDGSVSTGPMKSFYAKADYFGFNSDGELVLLTKEILDTPYQSSGQEDQDFNGAAVMKIYDAQGYLQLRILELVGGGIVFLFEDNTWIDSEGNTGFVPRGVERITSAYGDNSQVHLNRVQAQNVSISFAGANTTLTDNGSEDNINIIADNVTLAAQDGGNVFSQENRLVIAPNTSDVVNLQLVRTDAGGAFNASAYVAASGIKDKLNLHDTLIGSGGLLDLLVPAGNAELNNVGVDSGGRIGLTVDSGDITMNDVQVSSGGTLGVVSGEGDVVVDQVTTDGTLQITTEKGNLLAKDEDSVLNIGPNSTAAAGDTWLDIGGDIGTADLPFQVNILPDTEGNAQPLNIKNVVNIYLTQKTGSGTGSGTLPTNGRDKNGTVGSHDEAANDMEDYDEQVQVTLPAQTPEEIAAQLSNGTLTKEQLLSLLNGKLTGKEIKSLLGIDDAAVEALISALNNLDVDALKVLAASLNLGVAEPESQLDLSVLDEDDPQKMEELATSLGLDPGAGKDDILDALRTKLGLAPEADVTMIKTAYAQYYQGVLDNYRAEVASQYRASIEALLNADTGLSDSDIKYLFDLGLSPEEAGIAVLLAGALAAQKPVVIGADGDGKPIYQQAVDESGNPLFVDGTDENGDPIQIPVYVMESRVADSELFAAYWQSLSEEQKQELVEAAWALAKYPEPEDAEQYRVLVINIGESTGKSSISNLGDIKVTQQTGTFTAEDITSKFGDVSLTGPEIAGVEGKANVTGENISLTATTGSITGLNVEQRSWEQTVIGNITDEDKKNQDYGQTGGKSWVLVRNAETGQIEMQFAVDYTTVRDLNLDEATSITASAPGDIEINEVTGDMGVNVIEAGGKVKLFAPGSIYDVRAEGETKENITGSGAELTAGGSAGTSQNYLTTNVDGVVRVVAGGDINISGSGDLTLVADSSSGQVSAKTPSHLNLSNTTGNLVIGTINAGGNAVIISVAGIIAGDKATGDVHVKAKSIELTAQEGSIGTANAPIEIDTDAEDNGTLSAWATNGAINISERDGDLVIKVIEAKGDGTVNITAAGGIRVGSVTSTGGGDVTLIAGNGSVTGADTSNRLADAAEAVTRAKQARSAADLAAAQVVILQNYVTNILPGLLGRPAAQQALDTAIANLAAAQQSLADIKAQIDAAQDELDTLQNEKDLADSALAAAEAALAQAVAELEELTDPEQIAEQERLIAELAQDVEAARQAAGDKQKELGDKQAEIAALQSQEAELENVTIPELTRIKDEAQAALDAIDAQLAQAQVDLVDAKAAERDSLEATALSLEGIAAAKLAEAETASSSIATDGNLNIRLLNGGTVGTEDNSLGVTAAGTVTITTGTGTSIYGLYLESGGNLYLAPVTVDGKVLINAKGNIQGKPCETGTIITAANVELNSLGGDIGAAILPLLISVDRLTAAGENVYIKNLKDLIIDTVAGGTVNIEVNGNITSGTAAGGGNGNNIIADQLNLDATGSIGSEDNRLSIDTDRITAESQNLYLDNNSGRLQIDGIKVPGKADIDAAGSVADGGTGNIQTGNLIIGAFGDVGGADNSLNVTVPGSNTITTRSTYGSVNVKNWYKPSEGGGGGGGAGGGAGGGGGGGSSKPTVITDPGTGVTVSGQGIDQRSRLVVNVNTPQAQDNDQLSRFINELLRNGTAMLSYNLSLNRDFKGSITVNIPVGMEFEGRTLTIISYQDGQMYAFNATVEDGMVSFVTDTLASYAVLNNQYTVIPYYGDYTVQGGKQLPMAAGQFQDVKPDNWYFAAVAYMHALKIMSGITTDRFEPNGTATRSMLAAMLYRLEGSPKVYGVSRFADVEDGAWYANAVIWAESQGIVKGYDDNLFGTGDPITREQLVVFLYRYSMLKGRDTSASGDLSRFVDADQVSAYAAEAMQWAVALGLIQGKGEDILDPAGLATRAEIAAVMQRYIEIYARILLVDDDLLPAADQ